MNDMMKAITHHLFLKLDSFKVGIAFFSLVLTSCASHQPIPTYPELTFNHKPKIGLNLAQIEATIQYQSPNDFKHIELYAPVNMASSMASWANQRLEAKGTSGQLSFVVQTASIVERALPVEDGIGGLLKNQQDTRYDANIMVEMRAVDPAINQTIGLQATAHEYITVPETMSLHERNQAIYELIEAVLQRMDMRLEQDIAEKFKPFLLY